VKKVKKSLLVLTALTLSGSVLLAACSKSGTNNASSTPAGTSSGTAAPAVNKDKVVLDFWTHWGSTTRRPIIEKIVSDFNGSQDHITVKHTYLPYGDGWTKELAAIAAGNPPDVIIQDIAQVAIRASKKQVMDLQPFMAKDNIKDRFFPNLYNAMLYKNDVYALPFVTDTRVLFYNKAIFKEAGLDPEKPPTTWAELEEYSKKIDKINNGKIERLGYHPRLAGGVDLFLSNADGGKPWLDDKGVYINSPNRVAALEWFNSWDARLGKKEVDAFKASFGSKTNDPLISGKLAMKIDAGTFWTQIRDFAAKKEDFGIAPMPEFKPGSGNWSNGGGFTIEIPYGAKHPQESWEFLKYMTDVDAQKYWAQYNFDNVSNIKASNDPDLVKDPVYKFTVDNLKSTTLSTVPVSAPDFASLLNPVLDEAIAGKLSPKDALDKAQKSVEDLVKQNTK
jgi:multiple sugar transport system substrate-binding protein